MYILTVDVGNTNTVFGVYSGGDNFKFEARVQTNTSRMADEYALMMMNMFSLHLVSRSKFEGAVISSVVPPVTEQLKTAVEMLLKLEPMIVGPGIKTGLNIKIDDPSILGADLCCAAVAAKAHYPLPAIIIDLGTASKVLAVNAQGDFLGGAIAGGVMMTFESLASGTAALPLITAGKVEKAIGKNTIDCMRSGVILGMAGMLDGFIDRFEEEMGSARSIIATGGLSHIVIQECKHEILHDPQLLLKGMLVIYHRNKKQ